MQKKRLDHLDVARGIAIIMVVWGHVDRRMDQAFFDANLKLVGDVIYSFHVALLFIISGALMRETLDRYDFPRIFSRIIQSTLLPFLSLSAIFMGINLVTPKDLATSPNFLEMLQGILLYQSSDLAPSGVLWFLFVLFSGIVLTAVLNKYLRLSFAQVLIAAVIIKLLSPCVDDVHLLAAGKFARHYVFLMLGIVFAGRVTDDRGGLRDLAIMLGAGVAFVPFFLAMNFYKPFFQLMTGILGSLVMLRLSALAVKYRPPLLELFKYSGVNSMLIFVFHMPFFTLIKPVIKRFELTHSFVGFGIWVILGCLLPLALGLLLQQVPTVYALLLGRKPVRDVVLYRPSGIVEESS